MVVLNNNKKNSNKKCLIKIMLLLCNEISLAFSTLLGYLKRILSQKLNGIQSYGYKGLDL